VLVVILAVAAADVVTPPWPAVVVLGRVAGAGVVVSSITVVTTLLADITTGTGVGCAVAGTGVGCAVAGVGVCGTGVGGIGVVGTGVGGIGVVGTGVGGIGVVGTGVGGIGVVGTGVGGGGVGCAVSCGEGGAAVSGAPPYVPVVPDAIGLAISCVAGALRGGVCQYGHVTCTRHVTLTRHQRRIRV
jgi:hypothetical protein